MIKDICPYCKIRPKKRKTCGHPECQHQHHIAQERKYFDKYLRKTDRRITCSQYIGSIS